MLGSEFFPETSESLATLIILGVDLDDPRLGTFDDEGVIIERGQARGLRLDRFNDAIGLVIMIPTVFIAQHFVGPGDFRKLFLTNGAVGVFVWMKVDHELVVLLSDFLQRGLVGDLENPIEIVLGLVPGKPPFFCELQIKQDEDHEGDPEDCLIIPVEKLELVDIVLALGLLFLLERGGGLGLALSLHEYKEGINLDFVKI